MIGKLVAFAFGRVAARTVDSLERRLVWSAIGGFLICAGAVFALVLAYSLLEAEFGTRTAAAALALGCIGVGLVGLWVPSLLDWADRSAGASTSPAADIAETVDEEAHAAVDALGPMQVVASAFMMGLSAGRTVAPARSSKSS